MGTNCPLPASAVTDDGEFLLPNSFSRLEIAPQPDKLNTEKTAIHAIQNKCCRRQRRWLGFWAEKSGQATEDEGILRPPCSVSRLNSENGDNLPVSSVTCQCDYWAMCLLWQRCYLCPPPEG